MSFFTIGFVIAAILYFVYNMKRGNSITLFNVIIAILLGLLSWFGVIIMLLVMSFTSMKKNYNN